MWVSRTVLISFIPFCNAAIFSSKVTTLVVYSLIVSISCRICWRKLPFNWIIAACYEATISDFIRSSIGFMASMAAFTVASSDAILFAEPSGVESGSKLLLFFDPRVCPWHEEWLHRRSRRSTDEARCAGEGGKAGIGNWSL
jgi:hypothetical protein